MSDKYGKTVLDMASKLDAITESYGEITELAISVVDNNNDEINKIQSVIDTTVAAIENGKVRSGELADKNIALKLAIRRAKNNNRSADVALFEATIAENERQISDNIKCISNRLLPLLYCFLPQMDILFGEN